MCKHYGSEYETKISQAVADKLANTKARMGWEYLIEVRKINDGFKNMLYVYNLSGQCFIGSWSTPKSEWVDVFGEDYKKYVDK